MLNEVRKVQGPIAGPFSRQELPDLPDYCKYEFMVLANVASPSGLPQSKEIWFNDLNTAYSFMATEKEHYVKRDSDGLYVESEEG